MEGQQKATKQTDFILKKNRGTAIIPLGTALLSHLHSMKIYVAVNGREKIVE
jgi:hypothetical protein